MKIRCDYCENTYEDTLPQCPYCGGPNPSHKNEKKPKTIEELKSWYKARNLPPEETTRFFIGKDYKGARAFGIYHNEATGEYIVYKNKADGTRAVRYQGKDEAYAVNELYQRLKDEIVNQKDAKAKKQKSASTTRRTGGKKSADISFGTMKAIIWGMMILVVVIGLYTTFRRTNNGYYHYNGNTYYRQSNDWYYYDDLSDSWFDANDYRIDVPSELKEADRDSEYYESDSWVSDLGVSDWDDSAYAERYTSSDDDSSWDWGDDSSWDWDSGSDWDSGGSDWDSDW